MRVPHEWSLQIPSTRTQKLSRQYTKILTPNASSRKSTKTRYERRYSGKAKTPARQLNSLLLSHLIYLNNKASYLLHQDRNRRWKHLRPSETSTTRTATPPRHPGPPTKQDISALPRNRTNMIQNSEILSSLSCHPGSASVAYIWSLCPQTFSKHIKQKTPWWSPGVKADC